MADQLGVHRRMVRQALASAEPPGRKQVEHRRPVIGPLRPFIDAILEADRNAPRKQRDTAHPTLEPDAVKPKLLGRRRGPPSEEGPDPRA